MSAYICSDKHIKVLAAFAADTLNASPVLVANELKRENIKSVNFRYNEKTRFTKYTLADFELNNNGKGDDWLGVYSYADILALCECLAYQSCEHGNNGWEQSAGYTILSMITEYARQAAKRLDMGKSDLWSI